MTGNTVHAACCACGVHDKYNSLQQEGPRRANAKWTIRCLLCGEPAAAKVLGLRVALYTAAEEAATGISDNTSHTASFL
jgi:hypothetical protein